MTKRNEYSKVIHVRVTPETLAALDAVTQDQDFDRSDFIREAIWTALDAKFSADARKIDETARG